MNHTFFNDERMLHGAFVAFSRALGKFEGKKIAGDGDDGIIIRLGFGHPVNYDRPVVGGLILAPVHNGTYDSFCGRYIRKNNVNLPLTGYHQGCEPMPLRTIFICTGRRCKYMIRPPILENVS